MANRKQILWLAALGMVAAWGQLLAQQSLPAQSTKPPNILVIFGDDIGYSNISAYNLGMMGYHTPNIDRVAQQGALFYRLLRATELHRGPRRIHYWTESVPYRAVESRTPRCRSWSAASGSYDR